MSRFDRGEYPVKAPSPASYAKQLCALGLYYYLAVSNNFFAGLTTALRLTRRDPAYWQNRIRELFQMWRGFAGALGVLTVHFSDEKKLAPLRGTIIAANHPSMVDAFVLLSAVPRAVCIMRSDLAASSSFSHLSRLAGYITNDRGSTLIRAGIERLARGENLIIFPEGTRSVGGKINSFKRGFALMATRTGTPVQTVIVNMEGEYFGKGCHLLKPSNLPVHLSFRLGNIFHPNPGETADAFASRLEAYFQLETDIPESIPSTDSSN
jgi:1-acyl-sn-glycerol-3-phosphate acyltransferase